MDLKELTPEQRAKIDAAKTPEEILAIAQEEGYELNPEELDAIAGGDAGYEDSLVTCMDCGHSWRERLPDSGTKTLRCPNCGLVFEYTRW